MLMKPINLAIMLGLAGAGGYLAYDKIKTSNAAEEPVVYETKDYEVAAPGRIEPKSGEIRLGATYLGRVEEVLVKVDDKVEEGELLLRLDDAEARAKLASAETEAEALREDREKAFASGREDVRKAEDAIYSAERAVTGARIELDYAISAKRSGTGSDGAVTSIGLTCDSDCPVLDTPLRQLSELFPDLPAIVVAIQRKGEIIIPHSDDQIVEGDDIYVVTPSNQVARTLSIFGQTEAPTRRVVIAGGGNVGLYVARELEHRHPGVRVKMIEASRARAITPNIV